MINPWILIPALVVISAAVVAIMWWADAGVYIAPPPKLPTLPEDESKIIIP